MTAYGALLMSLPDRFPCSIPTLLTSFSLVCWAVRQKEEKVYCHSRGAEIKSEFEVPSMSLSTGSSSRWASVSCTFTV